MGSPDELLIIISIVHLILYIYVIHIIAFVYTLVKGFLKKIAFLPNILYLCKDYGTKTYP